ncbi:hypothetical protein AB0L65_62035 [Nonomuraea sp. NPDC052116]
MSGNVEVVVVVVGGVMAANRLARHDGVSVTLLRLPRLRGGQRRR